MSNPALDSEKMDLDEATVSISTGTDIVMENKEQLLPEKEAEIPAESAAAAAAAAEENTIVPPPTQTEEKPTEMETTETPPSPLLTSALEALLGGLDPPAPIVVEAPVRDASVVAIETAPVEAQTEESKPLADILDNAQPMNIDSVQERCEKIEIKTEKTADVDEAESLLQASQPTILSTPLDSAPAEGEYPEWEADSSPYESSSDDSSSDDSSSEESDEGDAYKLLSPEEQARILMEGDGGSDDEGGKKGGNGAGAQLRTKNEIPDVVVPKPDVTITPEMPIAQLGWIETTVDNTVLIKAQTSGEYKVLESGSVLCLEDRKVIGAVAETIGRVQQPFYSVMFTNAAELSEAGMVVGTKVFYSENHSTYVFTQALKAFKGSDASNLHDEEVGAEEMEFSDDEAEAEHKRKVKQQRLERRGGKQNGGSNRGGHPLQQNHTPYDANKGLNYDDADDDGPYKPLTRPAGFAESVGRSEAPQEGQYQGGMNGNPHTQGQFRGRGRGGDRGRGDRGRGRGDRGRGRGSNSDRRGRGYSLAPQGQSSHGQPPVQAPPQNFIQNMPPPPFPTPGGQFPSFPQLPQMLQNPLASPGGLGNAEYSPHQPQLPTNWVPPPPPVQFQQFQQFQQAFANMQNIQNMQNQNGWPANPQAATSGAFINPAFFPPPAGAPNANANSNPNQNQNQNQNQWKQGQRGRGRGS